MEASTVICKHIEENVEANVEENVEENESNDEVYIFTAADFCQATRESVIITKVSKNINLLWKYFINDHNFKEVIEKINEQKEKGFVKEKFIKRQKSSYCTFKNYDWEEKYKNEEALYSVDLNDFSIMTKEQFFDVIFATQELNAHTILSYELNNDGTFVLQYETGCGFDKYYEICSHEVETE